MDAVADDVSASVTTFMLVSSREMHMLSFVTPLVTTQSVVMGICAVHDVCLFICLDFASMIWTELVIRQSNGGTAYILVDVI